MGIVAENLAADGDGVVAEPLLAVQVHGALVGADRGGNVADFQVEIADLVVQRQVRRGLLTGLERVEHSLIDLDGLPPVLFLLMLSGGVLELVEVHSGSAREGGKRRQDLDL